jgi:catalase
MQACPGSMFPLFFHGPLLTECSYFNHNPEGYHAIMMLFSDRGTPVSYRYADIFGINTYKFTKPVWNFKKKV